MNVANMLNVKIILVTQLVDIKFTTLGVSIIIPTPNQLHSSLVRKSTNKYNTPAPKQQVPADLT